MPPRLYFIKVEDAIKSRTYKAAGVDIEAGAGLVEAIKPLARSTRRAGVVGGLGGFGGLFDPRGAGFRDPILVAATDGVGTKLKLAAAVGRHDTVGIDLVAMCVNDLVVQGAEPLFFLDYFATGRLDPAAAEAVVTGIAAGCLEAGCALLGGETAELPGLYEAGIYDLAGFAVGAAERDRLITGEGVAAGDVVLGLASSGLHSNGFSLVRQIVEESGLALSAPAPFAAGETLAEALLRPTHIYVSSCLEAAREGGIRAMAHITGGGLMENIPRALPDGLGVQLQAESWPLPAVFRWIMHEGGVAAEEMARTFNCGIGMVAIAAPDRADEVAQRLGEGGESVFRIGKVLDAPPGTPRVKLAGLERAWRG